MIMALM